MRNLPPLSALRAFEATARTGSVTQAAQELHRTHGAVSRQLRLLRDHMGIALFHKEGTGLKPSEAGRELLAVAQRVFDDLESGYNRILRRTEQPGLHVACSATFAMRWLVPHLSDFYRAHPQVRIRLSMMSAREIRNEGADLVLAWNIASYPAADRARALPLGLAAFGPVCTPSYDYAGGRAVRIDHDHTTTAWRQWESLNPQRFQWDGELTFPHTHLCIEAALAGLGVALVGERLVRKEIEEGLLVAPHGFTPFQQGWMAIPAPDAPLGEDALALIAWMREAMTQ